MNMQIYQTFLVNNFRVKHHSATGVAWKIMKTYHRTILAAAYRMNGWIKHIAIPESRARSSSMLIMHKTCISLCCSQRSATLPYCEASQYSYTNICKDVHPSKVIYKEQQVVLSIMYYYAITLDSVAYIYCWALITQTCNIGIQINTVLRRLPANSLVYTEIEHST